MYLLCLPLFSTAVHGFERISYMTIESQTLTGINFVSNVKGTGGVFLIDGRIIALDDTGCECINTHTHTYTCECL